MSLLYWHYGFLFVTCILTATSKANLSDEGISLKSQKAEGTVPRLCPKRLPMVRASGPPKYQSQVAQDRLVAALLNEKVGGFFVELAANDPVCISNSYALEKWFGWHGLCIEGNPRYIPKLRNRRNCTVVHTAVDTYANQTVQFRVENGFSGGIVGRNTDNKPSKARKRTGMITLTTQTLVGVLDENCAPSVIDYFSLDVEGAEWRVLRLFPFDRYQFRILSIERPSVKLMELLKQNHYIYMKGLGPYGDQLWLHSELMASNLRRMKHFLKNFKVKVKDPPCHFSAGLP